MANLAPSGAFNKDTHVFPVRVYYEDTDAAGIVYYANYLRFAERARSEMLRAAGIEIGRLAAERGLAFAVKSCAIDYLVPARLDDALEVHTKVVEIGHASLRAEQTVKRPGPGGQIRDIARLAVRVALLDRAGRPARLPNDIRTLLLNLSQSGSQS
ncbi:MAG TPA: tol-pal system-associated acyl-CoA thioesterase [Alphaproteobacteria bacterium]|nr:tol-pal system-associated acyl-CoA thioesterase [Alphaproteobacteria bacterium]